MKSENSVSRIPKSTEFHVLPASKSRLDKISQVTLSTAGFGGAVVLRCEGRALSSNEAGVLSELIADVLPTAHRMIIDLTEVLSLDTAALGELVLIHMWADAAGYTLKFASPSASVRTLFESTNLVSLFDLYSSVAEASVALSHEEVQSA